MDKDTLLATLGCAPEDHRGVVNIPVYRGSTILFPTLADFDKAESGTWPHSVYGRYGTRTTEELEASIAAIEGADYAIVLSSGMNAIATALMAFLKSGDHLLMTDNTYGPCRRFCDNELKRFGVETTYYDPTIGAGIAALIKDNTRVVYTESPGSLTFEMQDIPAIAKAAHEKGCIVISDNTWGTPYYMRPFELGIDVSIHSATKYISGHSDLLMGTISCKKEHYAQLLRTFRHCGGNPSADSCYLAQRGLRTMGVRLKQHYANGLKMAAWLKSHPSVEAVLHPALPGAPGHELWKRDFQGACGLFSFVLKDAVPREALARMMDNLVYYGMGYSWGGFESLLIPIAPKKIRTASEWKYTGQALRIHVGLENIDELIADLERGLERLRG